MGYFRELPNIAYQSPLLHKNSSRDYLLIKNIFRRTKLYDFLENNVSLLDKFTIGDGDRPDTVAEQMYGDSSLVTIYNIKKQKISYALLPFTSLVSTACTFSQWSCSSLDGNELRSWGYDKPCA